MSNYELAAEKAAQRYRLDPKVFKAMIRQESGFKENVGSSAGARDIAQFMPATAKAYGVTLGDNRVTDDLNGAARYLSENLKKYGTIERALSVYNSGRPDAYKDPGFAGGQTYNYVRTILGGAKTEKVSGRSIRQPSTQASPTAYQSSTTPGVDNSGLRKQAALSYLQQGGVANSAATSALAGQYQALKDVPGTTTQTRIQAPAHPASPSSRGGAFTGSTPVAKLGKIIGTPYTGTHTLGNWQSDNAVDIAVPVGTPMVALQDGVIVKVTKHPQGAGRFAGDQITVRGANGNEYFYAHGLASVKPGQRVRKGQELGTTGSANGVAHLHFGQMKGDPRQHV